MEVTLYQRPHGKRKIISMTNIRPLDETWLIENNVKVSMEDSQLGFVIYGDDGTTLSDGETPDEITIIAGTKSCEECMAQLVQRLKERKNK